MIQRFVLSGKAKTIFRILELAVKQREQARDNLEFVLGGRPCPFRFFEASCKRPPGVSCEYMNCSVWKETFEK